MSTIGLQPSGSDDCFTQLHHGWRESWTRALEGVAACVSGGADNVCGLIWLVINWSSMLQATRHELQYPRRAMASYLLHASSYTQLGIQLHRFSGGVSEDQPRHPSPPLVVLPDPRLLQGTGYIPIALSDTLVLPLSI